MSPLAGSRKGCKKGMKIVLSQKNQSETEKGTLPACHFAHRVRNQKKNLYSSR